MATWASRLSGFSTVLGLLMMQTGGSGRAIQMGRVQSNEWTEWAKQAVQQGLFGTVCEALADAMANAKDAATKLKFKQAQKFAGCANVRKRR